MIEIKELRRWLSLAEEELSEGIYNKKDDDPLNHSALRSTLFNTQQNFRKFYYLFDTKMCSIATAITAATMNTIAQSRVTVAGTVAVAFTVIVFMVTAAASAVQTVAFSFAATTARAAVVTDAPLTACADGDLRNEEAVLCFDRKVSPPSSFDLPLS